MKLSVKQALLITMESKSRVNGAMLAGKLGQEVIAVGRVTSVSCLCL